jgi:hypothetical protein
MLYIVGGAARTGKSIIASRFMQDAGVPYFSLDILMVGLSRGFPEHGINPEDPDHKNAGKMWPVVRAMSINIIEAGIEYLLEGVSILPVQVNELMGLHPDDTKACFIGYTDISPEKKLEAIREHSAYPNNWSKDYSDQQLLDLINNMIKHSLYLRDECTRYAVPYFDQSEDFVRTIDEVLEYLKD